MGESKTKAPEKKPQQEGAFTEYAIFYEAFRLKKVL